jgi:hypothetical protein
VRRSRLRTVVLVGTMAAVGLATMPTPTFAASPSADGINLSGGKSNLVQDPAWVQLKLAGRVVRHGDGTVTVTPATTALTALTAASYPSSYYLDITTSQKVVEPEGRYNDDLAIAESDGNFWRFCAPGASAVTISYWLGSSVLTTWGGAIRSYTEPYGPHRVASSWGPTDTGSASDTSDGYATVGRSYLMHLAEQSQPPSYGTPGLVDFTFYPTHGASANDIRDMLNWEISSHNTSNWQNYFYARVTPAASSQAGLLRL